MRSILPVDPLYALCFSQARGEREKEGYEEEGVEEVFTSCPAPTAYIFIGSDEKQGDDTEPSICLKGCASVAELGGGGDGVVAPGII